MTCGLNAKNRKKCTLSCDNGGLVSAGELTKARLHAVCSCPRPDRTCRWKNRVFGEIDDAGITELVCLEPTTTQAPGTTTTQAPA